VAREVAHLFFFTHKQLSIYLLPSRCWSIFGLNHREQNSNDGDKLQADRQKTKVAEQKIQRAR
jgi:hypothetical protein